MMLPAPLPLSAAAPAAPAPDGKGTTVPAAAGSGLATPFAALLAALEKNPDTGAQADTPMTDRLPGELLLLPADGEPETATALLTLTLPGAETLAPHVSHKEGGDMLPAAAKLAPAFRGAQPVIPAAQEATIRIAPDALPADDHRLLTAAAEKDGAGRPIPADKVTAPILPREIAASLPPAGTSAAPVTADAPPLAPLISNAAPSPVQTASTLHAPAAPPMAGDPGMPTPPLQQLAAAVRLHPGERTIEIALNPPDLGRVRIDFDYAQDGVLRAVIAAEDADTLSLLRRQAPALLKELQTLSLGQPDLQFADGGDSAARGERPRFGSVDIGAVGPAEAGPPGGPHLVAPVVLLPDQTLNIRV